MRISVELSLYPMGGDTIDQIVEFIEDVIDDERFESAVNQMSTQLSGELEDVMRVVTAAMRKSFTTGAKKVLVAKFLNIDLPVGEPPPLPGLR
ncbi:MAG TPA: YkoF family thiamine/hydroxymethylpyrimidine-binding protein [Gammaproteobacteria bacterium]